MKPELLKFLFGDLAPVLISIAALAFSLWVYHKTKRKEAYTVFDTMYFELLTVAMEHPDFRNPKMTMAYRDNLSGKEMAQYQIYAFMCWNFCETVVDQCDEDLLRTWNVVLHIENELHRTWFDEAENHNKFKTDFREYVKTKLNQK